MKEQISFVIHDIQSIIERGKLFYKFTDAKKENEAILSRIQVENITNLDFSLIEFLIGSTIFFETIDMGSKCDYRDYRKYSTPQKYNKPAFKFQELITGFHFKHRFSSDGKFDNLRQKFFLSKFLINKVILQNEKSDAWVTIYFEGNREFKMRWSKLSDGLYIEQLELLTGEWLYANGDIRISKMIENLLVEGRQVKHERISKIVDELGYFLDIESLISSYITKCDYEGLTLCSKLNFGKYKGRSLEDVILADLDYIAWCVRKDIILIKYEEFNKIKKILPKDSKIDLEIMSLTIYDSRMLNEIENSYSQNLWDYGGGDY